MKTIMIIVLLATSACVHAQRVGIGTTTPHTSAKLDISADNGGILIPRLTTAQRNAISPAAAGLLVYDSDTKSFWFYTGTAWSNLSATTNTWSTGGNAGTDPVSNYIGTTDEMPLVFRVSNLISGRIDSASAGTSFGYRTMPGTVAFNSAFGFKAMLSNTNSVFNTAIGAQAMYSNTSGNNNTAVGTNSLFSNTSGFGNTAVGYQSLFSNTNGVSNTSIGEKSLIANTGNGNTALGTAALTNKTTGNNNTAVGLFALSEPTGGSFNIAIGASAGTTATSWSNTISIGNHGILNDFSNQAFIGNFSTGWIGGCVGWSVFSDARLKTNVKEEVKGLDFITRLRPVLYSKNIKEIALTTGNKETPDFEGKYEIESIRYSGFIAQEVEDAAKQSDYNFSGVKKINGPDGFYTLSYESFVVPLVKAVQEQQKEIEELKKMIETLLKTPKTF
jgi:trimeric autotransporter adhesin